VRANIVLGTLASPRLAVSGFPDPARLPDVLRVRPAKPSPAAPGGSRVANRRTQRRLHNDGGVAAARPSLSAVVPRGA
jgi:hypothetical protein